MLERLEEISKKYDEIKAKLSTEEVIKDIEMTTKLSKELSSLEDLVEEYKK